MRKRDMDAMVRDQRGRKLPVFNMGLFPKIRALGIRPQSGAYYFHADEKIHLTLLPYDTGAGRWCPPHITGCDVKYHIFAHNLHDPLVRSYLQKKTRHARRALACVIPVALDQLVEYMQRQDPELDLSEFQDILKFIRAW